MGDGRYDSARLVKAVEDHSQVAPAARHGGAGEAERRDDQRRHARVARRLRAAADPGGSVREPRSVRTARRSSQPQGLSRRPRRRAGGERRASPSCAGKRAPRPRASLAELERAIAAHAGARPRRGRRRCAAARSPIRTWPMRGSISTDWRRSGRPTSARSAGGRLLREIARHLAVRMSYEDVIRVAQAKIDPATAAAHRRRDRRQAGRAVHRDRVPQARHRGNVLDPAALARQAHSRRRRAARLAGASALGDGGQHRVGVGLSALLAAGQAAPLAAENLPVRGGAARDRGLADARSSRRRALSGDLALEVAECARLIKGYGDTHKRGSANYRLIESA